MATLEAYPYVSDYRDRHGKQRWRFRRKGKTVSLKGEPGSPEFDAAYSAAIEGRPIPRATVHRLPTAAAPKSMKAAWRIAKNDTIAWKEMSPETQAAQTKIAERFLLTPVAEGEALLFGDMPMTDLRRRHVQAVLARWSATPHAARHILRLIRRLTGVALDQEWIETDPTYRLSYRPAYKGWRAWTDDECARFEERWPIGSTPRLAYSLALYTGSRRSDVARLKWADLEDEGIRIVQKKTGKELWIPIRAVLRAILDAAPKTSDYILLSAYGAPYSIKALGMRMKDWTTRAGLEGVTLHGLRKTLGKNLAEHGATTRQIMDILGHDDIAHAELYTRDAEQRRLAADGMSTLDRPRLLAPPKARG